MAILWGISSSVYAIGLETTEQAAKFIQNCRGLDPRSTLSMVSYKSPNFQEMAQKEAETRLALAALRRGGGLYVSP